MRFGIIGKTLKHSFSPGYFAEKFRNESIDATYSAWELNRIEDLPALLNANPDIRGLNVTIPYKKQVCSYVDELFGPAAGLGVVNTLVIKQEQKENQKIPGFTIKGFNTDIFGFKESIKPLMRPWFERALILGTGASSESVAYVLFKLGIDMLFVSRNPEGEDQLGWEEVNEYVIKFHPLIINTTPVGQWPETGKYPEIPYEALTEKHLLYDLIYNPEETQFLLKGKAMGAQIHNGLSMLKMQAEQSWKTWGNSL